VNFSDEAFTLVTDGQIGESASQRVCESASQRISESASLRISESASLRISESASLRISESASQRVSELANQQTCPEALPEALPEFIEGFIEGPGRRIGNPKSQIRNPKSEIRNPKSAVLFMGLGQVRDLRQSAAQAIIAERTTRPIADLRDLVRRVELRAKEVRGLIQCGALDGLGESRAAMLAEADEIRHAGRGRGSSLAAGQMAFPFARPQAPPETPAQRLAWEQQLLGLPVSVHPLDLVADTLPDHLPLRDLPDCAGRPVTVVGVRLPGWTGGPGFFLSDADTFVIVRGDREMKAPPPWRPVVLTGRWLGDGYFRAEGSWETFRL